MTPYNLKKGILWAILFAGFFCLVTGEALSATPVGPGSQTPINNIVKAPVPQKPGTLSTGTSHWSPGQANLNKTPGQSAGGDAAACPLSFAAGPKGDIRDIRGPIHIPDSKKWAFYALGGALMLLLFWLVWKWLQNRQARHSKTAFEIAFEELEKAKALMIPEKAERFSVMVSNTIRTYIEKRFKVRATRKTTREFMTMVSEEPSGELKRHRQSLKDFLAHCDLAKFARQSFSVQQMEKMLESAWRFVEETKPRPQENESRKSAAVQNGETEEVLNKSLKGRRRFLEKSC